MVLFSSPVGADADVTYAEVHLKPIKKAKRIKGKVK